MVRHNFKYVSQQSAKYSPISRNAGLSVNTRFSKDQLPILFLGLSAAVALSQIGASRAKILGTNVALSSLLAVGVIGGVFLFGNMTGAAKEIVLSFGAAALLYLVTEELLVEAHEAPETPLLTAMFFVGFVVLLVIEMIA